MLDTREAAPTWPPLKEDARRAGVLGACSGVSAVLILPYLLTLIPELREVPLPALILAQLVQVGLLGFGMSLAGLRLGHRVDLGTLHRPGHSPGSSARLAVTLGVGSAIAVIALSLLFDPLMPPPAKPIEAPGPLFGLLASFYGAIYEEVLTRLFLLTLMAWGLWRALGRPKRLPDGAIWAAILGAALAFGAAHLPAASSLWPLTPIVILRTLALNMIVAIPAGWLYWRRGLLVAMLAHFAADLVLHVLLPLLVGGAVV